MINHAIFWEDDQIALNICMFNYSSKNMQRKFIQFIQYVNLKARLQKTYKNNISWKRFYIKFLCNVCTTRRMNFRFKFQVCHMHGRSFDLIHIPSLGIYCKSFYLCIYSSLTIIFKNEMDCNKIYHLHFFHIAT